MSNHTPGPWMPYIFKCANDELSPGVVGPSGGAIAWVNDEKNASLIAAVPDLLGALEELLYARTDKAEWMAAVAIKKATGKA